MNAGPAIGLTILIAIIVVSFATIHIFRWFTHWRGTGEVAREGIIQADNGLEVVGFLFLYKKVIKYSDVRSVALISPPKTLLFLFQRPIRWICRHPFGDIVAIELQSPPQYYRYMLVAPKEPATFVEELNRRIEDAKA